MQLASERMPGASGEVDIPSVTAEDEPAPHYSANSVREGFEDWAVECKIIEAARRCSMGQYHEDKKTGRTIIAIAIFPPADGLTRVLVLMPFGLSLSQGIRLKMDGQPAAQIAPFATCVADGCLVPMVFSGDSIDALKHAGTLAIAATVHGTSTEQMFEISLKGFAAAYGRLISLK